MKEEIDAIIEVLTHLVAGPAAVGMATDKLAALRRLKEARDKADRDVEAAHRDYWARQVQE
jgi:hypothetical protein